MRSFFDLDSVKNSWPYNGARVVKPFDPSAPLYTRAYYTCKTQLNTLFNRKHGYDAMGIWFIVNYFGK